MKRLGQVFDAFRLTRDLTLSAVRTQTASAKLKGFAISTKPPAVGGRTWVETRFSTISLVNHDLVSRYASSKYFDRTPARPGPPTRGDRSRHRPRNPGRTGPCSCQRYLVPATCFTPSKPSNHWPLSWKTNRTRLRDEKNYSHAHETR